MPDKNSLSIDDLKEIQAGPVAVVPTRYTAFIFFVIDANPQKFRDGFKARILPSITTSFDARTMQDEVTKFKSRGEMVTLSGINVSFSSSGLKKLLADPDPKDPSFTQGQFANATALGDKTTDWLSAFSASGGIDGFFEIKGYPVEHVVSVVQDKIMPFFKEGGASLKFEHYGHARPGDQKGHEHFGFNDGISQPFVKYADDDTQIPKRKNFPGQTVVDPGVLILGQPGDTLQATRPAWAKNGSFVVYRHLKQLVPEFNDFLRQTAVQLILDPHFPVGSISSDNLRKSIDYLGARLMGRWKSGLPVVLTPVTGLDFPVDHPTVGKDKYVNNDFDYGARSMVTRNQSDCPFAAHSRKTGPRTDIPQADAERHMIRRGGIPYGAEVQPEEVVKNKTSYDRGLSFVCYQSSLADGFEFIQKSWSNEPDFISSSKTGNISPGFDPIIGQNQGKARPMTGSDTQKLDKSLDLGNQFVVSQGGEYFFLPSISTLNEMITK